MDGGVLEAEILEAVWRVVFLSAVTLGASAVVGVLVGVAQAATQIQDQTIAALLKFITVSVVLYVAGGSLWDDLVDFTRGEFDAIVEIGRLSER